MEGLTLFLGAGCFLATSASHLLRGRPQLALLFVAVAAMDVAEAGLLGWQLKK